MALGRRLLLAAPLAMPAIVRAQGFPSRPVTWVVPGGPGSVLDVGARLIAQKMAEPLGQQVVVENRTGAGGTIAADYAARAAPDGHTVFYGNFAVFAIAPLLIPNLGFDALRDFVPVHGIGASANLVVTGAQGRFGSLGALAAEARAKPEQVTFAAGVGSGQHAAAALFAHVAGVKLVHVPYNNTAQALTDVGAGRIDVMFDYPLSSLPLVQEGRLRALAVNAPQRLALSQQVPTIAEAGFPGAELEGWAGLYAPARTPAATVAKLAAATRAALQTPEVKQLFDSTGTILWTDVDAGRLQQALVTEIPRMRELIGRTGAQGG